MRPPVLLALAAAVSCAIAAYALFAPSGAAALRSLEHEERTLDTQIKSASSSNAALIDEVELLQDPTGRGRAFVEKRAREELGVVGKDEVVATLPSATAPATTTTATPEAEDR